MSGTALAAIAAAPADQVAPDSCRHMSGTARPTPNRYTHPTRDPAGC